VAVGEENYSRAVELRNVITDLRETLPPAQQFLVQKLQELELGSSQEQEESLKAIGRILAVPLCTAGRHQYIPTLNFDSSTFCGAQPSHAISFSFRRSPRTLFLAGDAVS